MKKYLLFGVLIFSLIGACSSNNEENLQKPEPQKPEPKKPEPKKPEPQKQKPVAYDWDFYTEPSRLTVVKNEKNPKLKKLYYQIYGTPCGAWYDGISPTKEKNERYLRNLVEGAERTQKTPIIVIYGIPHRDCGFYSKGGHPNAASYKEWINHVSTIIGNRRAVVIVEPDAINYCNWKVGSNERKERAELLNYVGLTLKQKNPNVATYIHAGSAGLPTNAAANAIIEGGVEHMRGFAFNVSGVGGTKEEQEGAEKLVARLEQLGIKNKHYVIDTGRSGINRPKNPNPKAPYNSCNNFAAALGPRSTKNTTGVHADAYLWINGGGGSDGDCGTGAPAAGKPYPKYTKALVENALRVKSIKELEVPKELQ